MLDIKELVRVDGIGRNVLETRLRQAATEIAELRAQRQILYEHLAEAHQVLRVLVQTYPYPDNDNNAQIVARARVLLERAS